VINVKNKDHVRQVAIARKPLTQAGP